MEFSYLNAFVVLEVIQGFHLVHDFLRNQNQLNVLRAIKGCEFTI